MAGPNHRRNCPLALLGSWLTAPIGSDRPPACESERSGNRFFLGQLAGIGPVRLIYSRDHQRMANPPLTISSAGERPRLGQCECPVVDIAQPNHPVGYILHRRLAVAFPAPFTQLAVQIGNKFRPAGGEPPDIVQRQFFQLFRR